MISNKAINVLNAFVADIFVRIVNEAIQLVEISRTNTITCREIQTAIRFLILDHELCNVTISESVKTVSRYLDYKKDEDKEESESDSNRIKKNSKQSNSFKAGLLFPVGRVLRIMKDYVGITKRKRVSETAPVYLTAVLEYLTGQILKLAADRAASQDNKIYAPRRITPRTIYVAIHTHTGLSRLCKHTVIPNGGGTTPFIHPFLLPSRQ